MITGNFIKTLLAAAVMTTAFASCSDDIDVPSEGPGGEIENTADGPVSIFHITAGDDIDMTGKVNFRLANPAAHENLEFTGEIEPNSDIDIFGRREALTCRMNIGSRHIPDGRYAITVSDGNGASTLMRVVRFTDNIGVQEQYQPGDYNDLRGAGTKDDPYLIGDAGDFLYFQARLMEDEFQGYGRYFLITRGFELPRRSQIIDGREWVAVCFQGNLDGGGHTLRNLAYTGGSDPVKDSGVGLFKSLFNANISNLKLSGALITNAVSDVGLIAGTSGGSTTISSISIEGTIQTSGNSTGGVVGAATDNLTLKDVTVNTLSVTGSDCTGLLIGSFTGNGLEVSNVSTPTHVFSVTGADNVGAVTGLAESTGGISIVNVTLEHSVDAESSDVRIIHGNGHVGTIAGKLTAGGSSSIKSCTVKAPVSGGDYCAAMIGEAVISGSLAFDKNLLASVVRGNDFTGGFFGKAIVSGEALTFGDGNRYVVKQSAEAGVHGKGYVGGVAGCIESSGKKIMLDGDLEIAVNVRGTDRNVGGGVGLLAGTSSSDYLDFDITGINFSSPTMRVDGSADGVGGVVGWSRNAHLHASESFDLLKKVPSKGDLHSACGIVVNGASTTGGIVGVAENGIISDISCNAVVTASSSTGSDHGCGGIVGFTTGPVSGCAFFGTVNGQQRIGGIAGLVNIGITTSNCLNYADIKGGKFTGGVIGYLRTVGYSPSHVKGCVNYGNLTDGMAVGGIVGREGYTDPDAISPKHGSIIENCGNYGNINANGNGDYGVGGIIGDFGGYYAHLKHCANHGDVSSQAVAYAIGGVAGTVGESRNNQSEIAECMNSGTITCASSKTKLGGVIGHFHEGRHTTGNCTLHDCVNTGAIPPDQNSDTGGIVGIVTTSTDTYRTFNRGKVSHGNAIIGTHNSGTIFSHDHNYYLEGTGKSWPSSTSVKADKITDKSVYKEFDFDNIWIMTSDGPMLRNCPFQ